MAASRRLHSAVAGLAPSTAAAEARSLVRTSQSVRCRTVPYIQPVLRRPRPQESPLTLRSSRHRQPRASAPSRGKSFASGLLAYSDSFCRGMHAYSDSPCRGMTFYSDSPCRGMTFYSGIPSRGMYSQPLHMPVGGPVRGVNVSNCWVQKHRACSVLPISTSQIPQKWSPICSRTLPPPLVPAAISRPCSATTGAVTGPQTARSRSFSRHSSLSSTSTSSLGTISSTTAIFTNSTTETINRITTGSTRSSSSSSSSSSGSSSSSSSSRRKSNRGSSSVSSVSGSSAVGEAEAEAQRQSNGDAEGEDVTLLSVRVPCPGDKADALVDCLLSVGAISCSIEDANSGTQEEEEIYGSTGDMGPALWDPKSERRLWVASSVTALFPAGFGDVGLSLRLAAQAALVDNSEVLVAQALQSVTGVPAQDWVQSVKDQFNPVQVDPGFWVVPPWCTVPQEAPGDALSIVLEPGLAFGTGEHPTTGLCLRWLRAVLAEEGSPLNASLPLQSKADASTGPPFSASVTCPLPTGSPLPSSPRPKVTVLDFGCGSGILSIAALKLGAESAVGIDIDPLAVTSSRQNLAFNFLDPARARFLLATEDCPNPLRPGRGEETKEGGGSGETSGGGGGDEGFEGFDIVVANILLNPLLQLAGDLAGMAKPGARIGLSGVLVSQVERVLKVYEPYATLQEVKDEDGWALIHLKRNE